MNSDTHQPRVLTLEQYSKGKLTGVGVVKFLPRREAQKVAKAVEGLSGRERVKALKRVLGNYHL